MYLLYVGMVTVIQSSTDERRTPPGICAGLAVEHKVRNDRWFEERKDPFAEGGLLLRFERSVFAFCCVFLVVGQGPSYC